MKITSEISLEDFEAWSGGRDTLDVLTSDQCSTLESIIEDMYYDGIDETQLNDILWFEKDNIADWLGFRDWEHLERVNNGEDDDEEEIEGVGLVSQLQSRFDSRASFYGKAVIDDHDPIVTLYSYDTKVAEYNKETGALTVFGWYSTTTARHIREFARQLGIVLPSGKDIEGTYY